MFSPLETLALSLACGAIFENGKGSLFRREGPAEGSRDQVRSCYSVGRKAEVLFTSFVSGCECNTGKDLTSSVAVDLVLSPLTSTYCKLVPGGYWTLKKPQRPNET